MTAAVFFLDRTIKQRVIHSMVEGDSFPIVQGIFYITRVQNSGAAFGLFQGQNFFLIVIGALFLFLIGFYIFREKRLAHRALRGPMLGVSLMAGGACGNLVDRVIYGTVIDYLDFRIWPVFNMADACICVGLLLLMIQEFFLSKKARI